MGCDVVREGGRKGREGGNVNKEAKSQGNDEGLGHGKSTELK